MTKTIKVVLTVASNDKNFASKDDGRTWMLIYDGKTKVWKAVDRDAMLSGLTKEIRNLEAKEQAFESGMSDKEKQMEAKESDYETNVNKTVSDALALIEPIVKENK